MGSKVETTFFGTGELLTGGHYANMSKNQSGKGSSISEIGKKLAEAQKQPYVRPPEEMKLQIYNKQAAGKTKVVGSAIFVFNKLGVAEVSLLFKKEYDSLLRQPGYSDRPAALPVVEADIEESEVVEEIPADDPEPVVQETEPEELAEDKEEAPKKKRTRLPRLTKNLFSSGS
jgi:hypothetical protein